MAEMHDTTEGVPRVDLALAEEGVGADAGPASSSGLGAVGPRQCRRRSGASATTASSNCTATAAFTSPTRAARRDHRRPPPPARRTSPRRRHRFSSGEGARRRADRWSTRSPPTSRRSSCCCSAIRPRARTATRSGIEQPRPRRAHRRARAERAGKGRVRRVNERLGNRLRRHQAARGRAPDPGKRCDGHRERDGAVTVDTETGKHTLPKRVADNLFVSVS